MPSILQILFSSIAAGLGIVFNGYILFVFVWNRRIQTANRLLLLHLAFVNTVFCLVILLYNTSLGALLSLPSLAEKHIIESLQSEFLDISSRSCWCQGHGFLWTLLPLVLVWNVCGLSCDRYAAISSPLHYSRLVNTRRALYFVLIIWFVGVIFASLPLIGVCPYIFWNARWACATNCLSAKTIDLAYAISYAIVAVVLPLTIILLCNLHMVLISKYHRHSIATAIYEVTLKAQVTVTHQRNPSYLSKFKGRNALFTIAQVIGSLTIFVVPYHVVLAWEAAKGRTCDEVFVSITAILLTCSPSINAYVYGVKSRMLRQTVKRLLQQHVMKKETNRNMKRRLSEIFSEHPQRQLPSRRMSAPPEYGRKTSTTNSQSCLPITEGSDQAKSHMVKVPFLRSISLPTNTPTADSQTIPKTSDTKDVEKEIVNSTDTVTSRRRSSHKPLPRGQSAPEEDIMPCDLLTDEEQQDQLKSSQRNAKSPRGYKKTFFSRSSSYPSTQQPSFKTSKRKRLLAMKEQHAIEIDDDIEEVSRKNHTDTYIFPSIFLPYENIQNQMAFQVSQV